MVERDLAAADQGRRRGAELVLPRSRWWYLMVVIAFALWGSTWDAPMAWRWVAMLAFAAISIVLILLPRRRARPLPIRFGWRYWLLIWGIATAGIAASLGVGILLRALAVPLPFTLSGLVLGIGTALLVWWGRQWRVGYVEQVVREPW